MASNVLDQLAGMAPSTPMPIQGGAGILDNLANISPKQVAKKSEKGILDRLLEGPIAAGEVLATVGSSAVAYPVSKVVGQAVQLYGGGTENAKKAESALSEQLTYQPKTEAGKEATSIIGEAFDVINTPAKIAGKTADYIVPGLGYPLQTAGEIATPIGIAKVLKTAKGVKGKIAEAPVKEAVPKGILDEIATKVESNERPVTNPTIISELEKPTVKFVATPDTPQRPVEPTLRAEPTNISGTRVYRGGDAPIDVARGGNRGISVATDRSVAETFVDPDNPVVGEAILPEGTKILKEADIPQAMQTEYIGMAKKLANLPLRASDRVFSQLQKAVIEKQQTIIDYARANDFDAVEFPFEQEIRVIKPNVLEMTEPTNGVGAGIKEAEKQPSIESLEAMVKGGRVSREMPKYAEESSINLDRLETTNDIKEFLRGMTRANEEKIGKKSVSWEQTRKTAEELGWNYKDLIKQRKGKAFTAAEIDAGRQLHMNALTDLFNKIKDIPADKTLRTPEVKLDIMNAVNNYSEVLRSVSQASSEAGRALNIHKRMIENNPEFLAESRFQKFMQDIIKKNGADKITNAMIDELRDVDWNNPKAVSDIIAKYNKAKFTDMLFEVWINGLLSGPRTHARNIAGNTLALLTKPTLETPIASVVDFMRKGKSREYRFGEIPAEMYGAYRGIIDGVRAASRAWKNGMSSEAMTKIEFKQPSIPGKTGEIIRIPTRALTAADEFFKAIIYRSEIQRQAYRLAAKDGLSKEARLARMAELIDSPTSEMMAAAKYESQYRTFNKPLGHFGNAIMGLRDKAPGLRYIVPFIRTPANIFKFALERTPANFIKIAHDAMTKKLPLDKLPEELAKPLTGTAIGTAIYFLAEEGYITGGGPKNKKSKDILYSLGWQPYSIKIGDTYYGYNTMEPVGSIMGMAADFSEAARSNPKTAQEKAGRMIFSITRNLTSKTFVTGLSASLDAISDPERYAGDYLNRYVGSLIPSLVNTATQAFDDRARKIETPIDALKARIPILSKTLPEKRAGGRVITRNEPVVAKIISPMYISKGKKVNKKTIDRLITK